MSGGVLGVAGDILSVAFLCFLCSLAIQLYCAFSRRRIRPPTPLPATISTPPPPQPYKQLHLLRSQQSASCPLVSTIAPPLSPPDKLSSAYHVSTMACSLTGDASPLPCTIASKAHTADLAKLMQLENGEYELDVESLICVPPPRMLFTIQEESKDEEAAAQSNVASDTSAELNGAGCTNRQAPASEQVEEKSAEPLVTSTACTTCAHAAANGGAAGAACAQALLSQMSLASSEGGLSLCSTSTCPSSPSVSYISASSSPFPTTSPPRCSFNWAQSSSLPCSKPRLSNPTN